MKGYLFVGDTHNDLDFATNAAWKAKQHAAEIVQVGDWGFIWPGDTQLEALSNVLVELDVTMRFCDGNHDDHAHLKKLRGRGLDRGLTIAPNVIYQPRGSVHQDDDGTRFLFLGGAPSIDRASRVEGESWWREETITETDFKRAKDAVGPVHVLVTHDAPDYPPGFSPKGSRAYRRQQVKSMQCVDALIRHHRPPLHVHGHWHTRYARQHPVGTTVVGLNCNELDPAYLEEATLLWSRADATGHEATVPPP